MNFGPDDLVGVLKDRNRAREHMGSSLADIDPMCLDSKVTINITYSSWSPFLAVDCEIDIQMQISDWFKDAVI